MANSVKRQRRLQDEYAFPGFRAQTKLRGVFGDVKARVIALIRRSKKRSAAFVDGSNRVGTTGACGVFGISPVGIRGSIWRSKYGACCAAVVDV